MFVAIRYSLVWAMMFAAVVWPFLIISGVLLDWGASLPIAMLIAVWASSASFAGVGLLLGAMQETTGLRCFPRRDDDIDIYRVVAALVLCLAGSYCVIVIGRAFTGM